MLFEMCDNRGCGLQRTIKKSIHCSGIGLHSGNVVEVKFLPAQINTGVLFVYKDTSSGISVEIKASFENVSSTMMCTSITSQCGKYTISTIEHLMAALWGCSIDNIIVEVNATEIPIMDGSSAEFVKLFENVGFQDQSANKKYIEILKNVRVEEGDAFAELTPSADFVINMEIDFPHQVISKQHYHFHPRSDSFKHEISAARTFGFFKEVEQLKKMGLARGGSLDNAIVLDENGVMNEEGLRYEDEFVRHKVLDSLGDLYLAGYNILGRFFGRKSGHKLNNVLLRKLFEDKEAWRLIEIDSCASVAS
jgi:UDP-3-O-[3-hydroxymyristoyl] N-acetylglucosamine deacetylase